MSQPLQTCKHFHDNGGTCNSIAAKNQRYCAYHLRHRARLMRMAQARARNQRFDLQLPPLESMHAVQSALTQVMDVVAADMLDLKRADRLIRVLTVASRNLLKADKWPAAPVFHSDQAVEVDVAAEYGLPQDLDLDTPPEVAFPPSEPDFSDLSSSAQAAASATGVERPESPHPAPGSPYTISDGEIEFSPEFPISPENVEVCEIYATQGPDAAQVRCDQLERNRQRRDLRLNRKRYADVALRRNIRVAAEKLARKKLAEQQTQEKLAAGRPAPASLAGVGVSPDVAKKPPASVPEDASFSPSQSQEAELTLTGSHG